MSIPEASACVDGMQPIPNPAYTFGSADAAFHIVDLQNDQAQAYLVRDANGVSRYVCAHAGRESEGVTVAATFTDYLALTLDAAAHVYWWSPSERLADSLAVEAHLRRSRDRLANVQAHAAKNALAVVECVGVAPADLDAARALKLQTAWPK